jgi:hypothetical protein
MGPQANFEGSTRTAFVDDPFYREKKMRFGVQIRNVQIRKDDDGLNGHCCELRCKRLAKDDNRGGRLTGERKGIRLVMMEQSNMAPGRATFDSKRVQTDKKRSH